MCELQMTVAGNFESYMYRHAVVWQYLYPTQVMSYTFCVYRAKLHLMALVIVILFCDSFNTRVSDNRLYRVSVCMQLST